VPSSSSTRTAALAVHRSNPLGVARREVPEEVHAPLHSVGYGGQRDGCNPLTAVSLAASVRSQLFHFPAGPRRRRVRLGFGWWCTAAIAPDIVRGSAGSAWPPCATAGRTAWNLCQCGDGLTDAPRSVWGTQRAVVIPVAFPSAAEPSPLYTRAHCIVQKRG
jgi:hypothetical protein